MVLNIPVTEEVGSGHLGSHSAANAEAQVREERQTKENLSNVRDLRSRLQERNAGSRNRLSSYRHQRFRPPTEAFPHDLGVRKKLTQSGGA